MSRKPRSKAQKAAEVNGARKPGTQAWAWILLAATVIFIAAVRIRLLQTPLERDEGEFGYMGQLILQGIPPYKIACNMKLPGTYLMYALFLKVFGNTAAGVHLGLMVMNLISTVLVFILARRMLGPLAAVVASASFGLLSVSPSVLGTSAHATHYVLPFALGGILLMLRAADSGKPGMLVLSGLLLGTSFLMKQHAVFFLVFALLYYLWTQIRKMPAGRLAIHAGVFSLAMATPYLLTCIALYKLGVFDKFWFWTFTYAKLYTTRSTWAKAVSNFIWVMPRVLGHSASLWTLGGIGLTAVVWSRKARINGAFLVGFLVFSFLTVCPGMYFRQHYFITLLPALAMLIGAAVSSGTEVLRRPGLWRAIPVILFALIVGHSVFLERYFLFRATPTEASFITYESKVFVATEEIGRYIQAHTTSKDKIVVFGSEPEICFYSRRRSGTSFIYTYPLMEQNKYASVMQANMMREIKASQPRYVVIAHLASSWAIAKGSDLTIFTQGIRYLGEHYELVGIAQFVSKSSVVYFWDEETRSYSPTDTYLMILRKRLDGETDQ